MNNLNAMADQLSKIQTTPDVTPDISTLVANAVAAALAKMALGKPKREKLSDEVKQANAAVNADEAVKHFQSKGYTPCISYKPGDPKSNILTGGMWINGSNGNPKRKPISGKGFKHPKGYILWHFNDTTAL